MRKLVAGLFVFALFMPGTQLLAAARLSTGANSAKPVIKKIVTQKSCNSAGDILSIEGAHFLPQNQHRLVIYTGALKQVSLKIISWSDQHIKAGIPKGKSPLPEGLWPVVMMDPEARQVISNRDKTIKICAQNSSAVKKITMKQDKTPQNDKLGSAKESQPVTPGYTTQDTGHSGSLMGQQPGMTQPEAVKKLQDDSYETGEIVVYSKDLSAAKRLAERVKPFHFRVKRRRVLKNLSIIVSVIAVPPAVKLTAAIDELQNLQPDMILDVNHRYQFAADDTALMQDVYQATGWSNPGPKCGEGVRLGMIDSLIDTEHSGLHSESITNKSLLPFGVTQAGRQHATSIASILIGKPGSEFRGLIPAAKLYAAGVFRVRSDGNIDTTAELIVAALDWLAAQQVQVINLSLAGPHNLLMDIAVRTLLEKEIMIVAAVGNHGLNNVPMYPAAIPGVVAVTATDVRDRIYAKANTGEFVQIAAPGVDLPTVTEKGKLLYQSGTSFAAPFVTAALAELRVRQASLPAKTLISRLYKQATDLGHVGKDSVFGWGRLKYAGCH